MTASFSFTKKPCVNGDGIAYGRSKYCDDCKMRRYQNQRNIWYKNSKQENGNYNKTNN